MTVVIGPNGSGKSNFIGVFSFLNAIQEGRLQEYVIRAGGADKVLHFGSRVTEYLDMEISFQSGYRNSYEIRLVPNESDGLTPQSELASFHNESAGHLEPYYYPIHQEGREAGISRVYPRGVPRYVRGLLASWRLYHFHDTSAASPMKKTADLNDNRYLRPDGSNLAAFLYFLGKKHSTSYRLIVNTIKQVAPFFQGFDLEPDFLNPEKIRLQWKHVGTDTFFDAASLSDGTLRFMAIATLFLQPKKYRPSVILIDEPELGMHPFAITLMAGLMKQASAETQVIVATQSSLLLDHFEPEQVLVAELIEGATQFTRLDSSKLDAWLEDYSLGQLWEKNELGGRPV